MHYYLSKCQKYLVWEQIYVIKLSQNLVVSFVPKNFIIYLIVVYFCYLVAIFINLVDFSFINLMISLVSCLIVSLGLNFFGKRMK